MTQRSVFLGSFRHNKIIEIIIISTNSAYLTGRCYASYNEDTGNVYINYFNVDSQYRNYGYGQAILKKLLNYCVSQINKKTLVDYIENYNLTLTTTILQSNDVASHLAEKYGFIQNPIVSTRYEKSNPQTYYRLYGYNQRHNLGKIFYDRINHTYYATNDNVLLWTADGFELQHEIYNGEKYLYIDNIHNLDQGGLDYVEAPERDEYHERYVYSFIRILQYHELNALKKGCASVIVLINKEEIFSPFSDETFANILKPLGYRYERGEFSGFIKEIR